MSPLNIIFTSIAIAIVAIGTYQAFLPVLDGMTARNVTQDIQTLASIQKEAQRLGKTATQRSDFKNWYFLANGWTCAQEALDKDGHSTDADCGKGTANPGDTLDATAGSKVITLDPTLGSNGGFIYNTDPGATNANNADPDICQIVLAEITSKPNPIYKLATTKGGSNIATNDLSCGDNNDALIKVAIL